MSGIGLSADEMDRLCKLPLRDKESVYAPVETWYSKNKDLLKHNYPEGGYMFFNASDFTWAIGKNHDDAAKEFEKMYGPTPKEGRDVFGIQL